MYQRLSKEKKKRKELWEREAECRGKIWNEEKNDGSRKSIKEL